MARQRQQIVNTLAALCELIEAIPARSLFRHNDAGDLPAMGRDHTFTFTFTKGKQHKTRGHKMSKTPDFEALADENCDHVIDDDIYAGCDDGDLLSYYREAIFYMQCSKCNGLGICVDDTGNFWQYDLNDFC